MDNGRRERREEAEKRCLEEHDDRITHKVDEALAGDCEDREKDLHEEKQRAGLGATEQSGSMPTNRTTPWKHGATAREELAQCIEHYGDWYKPRGLAAYLLRHAREYVPSVPTAEETAFVRELVDRVEYPLNSRRRSFRRGACYHNAHLLFLHARTLGKTHTVEYVEGVAMSFSMMNHAWVAINGKVLDVTWAFPAKGAGPEAVRVLSKVGSYRAQVMQAVWGTCFPGQYFGVPFDWLRTYDILRRHRPACRPPGFELGSLFVDSSGRPSFLLRE